MAIHVRAMLNYATQADAEPAATVTGVHESADLARKSLASGEVVLPILHGARTSRRPRIGETMPTMREASGLVAVVMPWT